MIARHKQLLFALALLLFLTLIAASSLFKTGWILTHEQTDPLQRVVALVYEIENGHFYPRWLSATYGGKGSPFTNFYSSGVYFASAYLHVLGLPLLFSVKAVCTSLFFIGASGVFFWTRRHYSIYGALLASVLYLFAPYHFVDIYVRGALAEFSALAFLPFLFWGIDLLFVHGRKQRGILLTALSTAALLICHTLSAIMIFIFALLYFSWVAYRASTGVRELVIAVIGPLMGVALSAFYWLPVIYERKYLKQLDNILGLDENPFVYVRQLFSTYWGFGGSVPGPNDEMSFQIGVVILVFAVLALIALVFATKKERGFPLVMLFLGILAVLFTLQISSWAYKLVPWLAFIQFPWRFLGPATLFLSALGGFLPEICLGRQSLKMLPLGAVIVSILLCLALSVEQRSVKRLLGPESLNSDQTIAAMISGRLIGRVASLDEYLPLAVTQRGLNLKLSGPLALSTSVAHISRLKTRGSDLFFNAVVASGGSDVTIPWFYFPGWQVNVDGIPVQATADSDGFLRFNLPSGRHDVKVWFGSTTPRTVGWILTLTAAAFCFCLLATCLGLISWLRPIPTTLFRPR